MLELGFLRLIEASFQISVKEEEEGEDGEEVWEIKEDGETSERKAVHC